MQWFTEHYCRAQQGQSSAPYTVTQLPPITEKFCFENLNFRHLSLLSPPHFFSAAEIFYKIFGSFDLTSLYRVVYRVGQGSRLQANGENFVERSNLSGPCLQVVCGTPVWNFRFSKLANLVRVQKKSSSQTDRKESFN